MKQFQFTKLVVHARLSSMYSPVESVQPHRRKQTAIVAFYAFSNTHWERTVRCSILRETIFQLIRTPLE